jgi:hypothetical protein
VIATLAEEINIPVRKVIGIYEMTEELVTGTKPILEKYHLPYVPMVHCFLTYDSHFVDLTVGNHSGKNHPIVQFIFTEIVTPMISEKNEYLLYKKTLESLILKQEEMVGITLKQILHARSEAIILLHSKVRDRLS